MPIIVAAIPVVANFIARVGVTKAAKKYAPKLIKEATAYIKKNKLIFDGKKLIKPPKGSITTVAKKTTKKMNVVKKSKNPRIPKKTDALDKKADDIIKKVNNAKDDGERILGNLDKSGNLFNSHIKSKFRTPKVFKKYIKDALKNKDATKNRAPTAYVDKFGNAHRTKAGADRANKLTKNPRIKLDKKKTTKKTTTKKTDDSKLVEKVNKPPIVAPKIKKYAKIGTGVVLGGLAFDQASKILGNMSKSKDSGPSTFGAAFKKARKEKGPNSTFTFKGKQYSTVTMDQVKKAGFNTLNEYLNAQKKKSKTTKPGT